ncbi:MAG: type II secretion system protein [Elusimicrobia bacterium]|nr:type II secretion system protein [Elusimicrobiota bacterium]
MKPITRAQAGFTLMELMVVVTIIGILAAFAIPQYLRSVETSKADDAAALMNMVATTNRMFALDHGGVYNSGYLTTACTGAIPNPCDTTPGSPCNLVYCKYLAPQDFDKKTYIFAADTPAGSTFCNSAWPGGMGVQGTTLLACTARKNATNCTTAGVSCTIGVGSLSPYTTWGYGVGTSGVVTSIGGAPAAVQP